MFMPPLLFYVLSMGAGLAAGVLANLAADKLPGLTSSRTREPASGPPPAAPSRAAWRSRAVVAALGALFPLLAWQQGGLSAALLVSWFYAWFLTTVLVIDLETRRVLNVMLGPAALLALAAGLWLGWPSLPSILAGGLVGFLLFGGLYLIGRVLFGRGALGLGDVKLAAVIGLMTGYPGVLQALLLGAVLGGVSALALLATRRAGLKSTCAYAPYLAIGAMLALWVGGGGV
jgi:leader peptidase (prepilin peptidase)/N-methyltransferase